MNTKQYESYFHLPEGIYALAHSVGPLPKVSKLALQEHYLAPWETLDEMKDLTNNEMKALMIFVRPLRV